MTSIQIEDLPPHIQRCEPFDLGGGAVGPIALPVEPKRDDDLVVLPSLPSRRSQIDRRAIRDALDRFDGDKEQAAQFVGISRATLYRRLAELR